MVASNVWKDLIVVQELFCAMFCFGVVGLNGLHVVFYGQKTISWKDCFHVVIGNIVEAVCA